MSVHNYRELARHAGHTIECAIYGDDDNAALECMDCSEILVDFNAEEEE